MAKKAQKKPKAFKRGCCLSGCLCYLGCSALLFTVAGVLGTLALLKSFAPLLHKLGALHASLPVMITVIPVPLIVLAIGIIEVLQVRAVWQGYRWGAYGLGFIALSQFAIAAWDIHSGGDLLYVVISIVSANLPLVILYLLLRPQWKAMR